MRFAARTDSTHKAIVTALRRVGCKVADTARVGQGFPDLVVRVPQWGPACSLILMEVKTARGKLNAEQERFIEDWPEVVVVRSVDEALAAVGVR